MTKRGLNLFTFIALTLLLAGARTFAVDSQTTLQQVHLKGTFVTDGSDGKPVKVTFTDADFLSSSSNSILVARINLGITTDTSTNATPPDLTFSIEEWVDENGNGELDTGDTMDSEIFVVNTMVLLSNGRFNATISSDETVDAASDSLVGHAITLNVRGRSKLKDLNNDTKSWEIRDLKSDVTGGDITSGFLIDGNLNAVGKTFLAFDEDAKPATKGRPSPFKHP